jgi:hypothetical protein
MKQQLHTTGIRRLRSNEATSKCAPTLWAGYAIQLAMDSAFASNPEGST